MNEDISSGQDAGGCQLSPYLPVDPRLNMLFFQFFTYSREDAR